jgi:rfaE bifunctional protein nucleotidyltransferase chain/domain
MAAGHFVMAFENMFFPALLLLILGNGCFKPNISTQVGNLYAPGDPRLVHEHPHELRIAREVREHHLERQRLAELDLESLAPALSARRIDTWGSFAYSCDYVPGSENNETFVELLTDLGLDRRHPRAAGVRRLFYEAVALAAEELKTKSQRREDDPPRRMPPAERASRLNALQGRLGTAVVHRTDLTAALYTHRAKTLQQKILPADTARDMVTNWQRDGLVVGFTNGCFDIMHAGHVTLLQDAKANCDRLIVGMNSDASVSRLKGPTRPVNHDADRAQLLAALSMVDMVILFEEDTPLALLEALKPNLLMKGADYTKENVVGWQLVESYGGKVVLLPLKEGYSTTGLIEKMAAGGRS